MSLAENLLNSLDETAYQNTRIGGIVPEEHIKVGQDRVITVPNVLKTIAVKGDKDIETATIDCVRYWDGHDLSTFAIYLNYILPSGDEGTYIPQSITKSEDTFSFDWLIGSEFTYAQGKMTFWIVAKLTDDSGTLIKQWSSFQNSDCTIAQGGDKIYVPEKQTDQDVISQAISISRSSAEIAEQQANLAKQAAVKAASDAKDSAEAEVSRIIGELGVVQELGNSPNSVISQAKVTKEFFNANAKIDRNFKAIENIKAGIPADEFETDDSVAYQKDVPANALPYAAVQKVGGMTRKCANLIPPLQQTQTIAGITYSPTTNGGIHIEGTATELSILVLFQKTLPSGDYAFLGLNIDAITNGLYAQFGWRQDGGMWDSINISNSNTDKNLDATWECLYQIVVPAGATLNHTIYPSFNAGDTAKPYEPYFEGLRSAKVTEVKSVGVNLLPLTYETSGTGSSGEKIIVNPDLSIEVSGKPTASSYNTLATLTLKAGTYSLRDYGTSIQDVRLYVTYGESTTLFAPTTFTLNEETSIRIRLAVYDTFNGDTVTIKPVLVRGSVVPQSYTQSVRHTLPIPEEVRPANGINENVYDYIEWAEDGSVKQTVKCGVVDLGTLAWDYSSADKRFYVVNAAIAKVGDGQVMNAICVAYTPVSFAAFYGDMTVDNTMARTGDYFFVRNLSYTDAATFKAAMSGVMLVYELAKPIVTDISDLITADNLIGVEGGGTLTFENEYGYAVPSEVEYQVEV